MLLASWVSQCTSDSWVRTYFLTTVHHFISTRNDAIEGTCSLPKNIYQTFSLAFVLSCMGNRHCTFQIPFPGFMLIKMQASYNPNTLCSPQSRRSCSSNSRKHFILVDRRSVSLWTRRNNNQLVTTLTDVCCALFSKYFISTSFITAVNPTSFIFIMVFELGVLGVTILHWFTHGKGGIFSKQTTLSGLFFQQGEHRSKISCVPF